MQFIIIKIHTKGLNIIKASKQPIPFAGVNPDFFFTPHLGQNLIFLGICAKHLWHLTNKSSSRDWGLFRISKPHLWQNLESLGIDSLQLVHIIFWSMIKCTKKHSNLQYKFVGLRVYIIMLYSENKELG